MSKRGMKRRHERIVRKADVRLASSDHRFAALQIVILDDVVRLAEQREARSGARSRESKGRGAARSRSVGDTRWRRSFPHRAQKRSTPFV
jgi:hypothetical protein